MTGNRPSGQVDPLDPPPWRGRIGPDVGPTNPGRFESKTPRAGYQPGRGVYAINFVIHGQATATTPPQGPNVPRHHLESGRHGSLR